MIDIKEARKAAFDLASKKYEVGKPVYSLFSPIYIAATSNVTSTVDLYKGYSSVLSVGSTGAHGFEVALKGAKKVDLFDINYLQKLYYEYMKTAIMNLDYETFIKHFTLQKQKTLMPRSNIKDLLSNELYSKLVTHLSDEVKTVFTPLYDWYYSTDLILSSLFRFEHFITLDYLKKNISFYNEEQYYELQKILRTGSCEINYETISLVDVPKHFNSEYDLIILDNILKYYKNISGLNDPYLVNMFIRKELSKLLAANGQIQVNYGFEVDADAFREKFAIPYEKKQLDFCRGFQLHEEKEYGINIPLIKEWSEDYKYDFIPGVERIFGGNSGNLVLSYRKK